MMVTKQRFEDGHYWSIWKITAFCLKLIPVAVLEYLARFLIEAFSQVPAPVFGN